MSADFCCVRSVYCRRKRRLRRFRDLRIRARVPLGGALPGEPADGVDAAQGAAEPAPVRGVQVQSQPQGDAEGSEGLFGGIACRAEQLPRGQVLPVSPEMQGRVIFFSPVR